MKKATLIAILLCIIQHINALPRQLPSIHWQLGDEGGIWSSNCDFPAGEDDPAPILGSTGVQCGQTCMETPACTHYTWSSLNTGTCQLKQGDVTRDSAVPSSEKDASCGIMPYKRPQSHGTF